MSSPSQPKPLALSSTLDELCEAAGPNGAVLATPEAYPRPYARATRWSYEILDCEERDED